MTIKRTDLEQIMAGAKTLEAQIASGALKLEGDASVLTKLASTMVDFDPRFQIMPGTKVRDTGIDEGRPLRGRAAGRRSRSSGGIDVTERERCSGRPGALLVEREGGSPHIDPRGMNTKRSLLSTVLAAGAIASARRRPAASALYEVGTADVGLAAAGYAARAQDASTVLTNPAGMTRLDGNQAHARRAGCCTRTWASRSGTRPRPRSAAAPAAIRSAGSRAAGSSTRTASRRT